VSAEKHAPQDGDSSLPCYDWQRSYEWNYNHAPSPLTVDEKPVAGTWNYCGLPVGSPLGIAAGPLLNGRWVLYYASLGFDVLTYKTVRSRARASYPLPNLQPVFAGRVAARVKDAHGRKLFDGERRGIAGDAIREAALDQIRLFARVIGEHQLKLRMVGVGGIATAQNVRAQLAAGSHAVQFGTAAMLDPQVGLKIRGELASG